MLSWFKGQAAIVKISLFIMGWMFLFGIIFMIGSGMKHSTNIAVKESAGRAKAESEFGQIKGVLNDVETRDAVVAKIEQERRSNAGRSCPDYNECLLSNRNGSTVCEQFLPSGPDNKPIDCSTTKH